MVSGEGSSDFTSIDPSVIVANPLSSYNTYFIGGGGGTGKNSLKLVKLMHVQKYMLNHSSININKTCKMHQIAPL